ncbi:GNAT family N-acetyltransferase [Vibrio ulleungensis]|uniref:GNAT family N-acetyltransferase n=1 Tax=Vibrio ulleungensis TaxID=2807619 RepID=A0ABS2HJ49_9VIBR|nr:GNAT family N-acetyltransferase [Vibrio ulleungensis]MBM7036089.1 GNAT family N-acetyltransferase [Vibrio ulleungensis]
MTSDYTISHRAYTDADYQIVIDFLGVLLNEDPENHNWLPGRFEYAEYLISPLFKERGLPDWKETIHLWFDGEKLIGMVNSENPDANTYIQILPSYQFLTEELIDWAENSLVIADWDNITPRLAVWANDSDVNRQTILNKRGFRRTEQEDYIQRQLIPDNFTAPELPDGYQYSSFANGLDFNSRTEVTALAFGDEVPLSESIYEVVRSAPNYRPELDIAVVDTKNKAIAVATFWLDETNRLAYLEPVATRPEYHGKGFAKKLLHHGMYKLKERGIDNVYVGAHAGVRLFYMSCGFREAKMNQMWEKWYPQKS